MSVAHVAVFINGCLNDSEEWYETRSECEAFLTDHAGFGDFEAYGWLNALPGMPDDATVTKYHLFDGILSEPNGLELSSYMAEIVEYPSWEFCDCIDTREYLDNETGIYDPELSVCCMACEIEAYDDYDAWEDAIQHSGELPDTVTAGDMR